MSEAKSNSEIIAGLAEEFVERYRRGERPPVSEYTALHPELADEIREFFAAVAMVENLAPAESESFGDADSDASAAALPPLKQLGDFRIIREVGRGGMGVVYEAEQVSLGRHVAIKVLPASVLPDDKHIRRFEREAKSAAKLHHTNIVPVFGVGTEDDLHFYVMQFIQGLPLDDVIEELKQVRAQPTGTIIAPVQAGEGGDSSRQRSAANVARSLMTGQFAQTLIHEIVLGHTMNVTGVAWSPDGVWLATSSFDKQVKTWDTSSGENLRTLDGHAGAIRGVDWSSDGRRLVSAGDDQTVRLWDVESGEVIHSMEGHTGKIARVRFSPDGRRIASASWETSKNPVIIWDAGQGRELLTLKDLNSGVWGVCWSSDGSQLATAVYGDSRTEIWDANSGEKLHSFSSYQARCSECAWSPDGTQIASAADDKTVRVFETVTGNEVQRFQLNDVVLSVDWSFDGRQLAAGSNSGELKIWNVATGHEIAHPLMRGQVFWTVRFSPDGTKLAAGGEFTPQDSIFGDAEHGTEGTLALWDLAKNQELLRFRGHSSTVRSLDWSKDGARLLSAGHDGNIILWDAGTGGQLLSFLDPDGQAVISARFSPDELQIASGGDSPGVHLRDATASYAAELSPRLLPTLQARIASNPTFDDLKLQGEILARQGQWGEAAESFERAALVANETNINADRWFTSPWWVAGPYQESLDTRQPPEMHLDPLAPVPRLNDKVAEPLTWEATVLGADQDCGRQSNRLLLTIQQS